MSTWFSALRADADAQLAEYRARRAATPTLFGNGPDGAMDGTHESGPLPFFCFAPDNSRGWLLWHVHKWPWPLDYIYCIGKAWDSAGERTDPLLTLDVRDLPESYVGRLKIDAKTCRRRNHRKIIGRALADGYELHAHAARIEKAELAQRLAWQERQRLFKIAAAKGMCRTCGEARAIINGECEPCSEIPF